ncbi:TPA: helix-turn-helix transcriptional regulator [Pseudomonas aeruginosa]|uniref:helix-turn-helix transcriptional regulator n=1 Tax=Pseudomonas aeruginosa TaxID=287 RepID=UPI000F8244D9|nr:helix-turn-helix domain-containing protein [Pseudomonas aeruginosa]RTX47676.1 XRE family transcriptional regulator [Pseudomonas aeruginosa]HCF9828357.1 helix-turn-helix transcriptional regulator [Pseudomonas aeruginosa]HEQ0118025.1 helix-turn-helix transcriptional regulator [Pseudomonas aeruginosa]HEQ0149820.1 helix-turn-helix transcriptional regulator [Pseudomonas aeruginosa]
MGLVEVFGRALREFRKKAGMVQEEFADVVGRERMSLLERGKRIPRLDEVDALARSMGVHPLTLLTRAYQRQEPSKSLTDLLGLVSDQIQRLESPIFETGSKNPPSPTGPA